VAALLTVILGLPVGFLLIRTAVLCAQPSPLEETILELERRRILEPKDVLKSLPLSGTYGLDRPFHECFILRVRETFFGGD